jgi:dTDP-4-dehydrorhamnose reductase
VKGKRELRGVRDQLIAPTHVRDLAIQIKMIYERKLRGTFHATSEGEVSPYDLLKFLSEQINGGNENIWEASRFDFFKKSWRPQNCILDNFNLEALKLNLMSDWKESVIKLIKSKRS